jgi:hypothetical protein
MVTGRDSGSAPAARASSVSRLWPVAVTIVIFAVIFLRIPFGRFLDAVASARLAPFLALIGSFSLCYFLVDTFVLLKMVRWFHGPLSYRELLPVRASTYVVSIVNTQLAQGALGLYIHRRFLTPLGEIFSTVAMIILLEVTQLIMLATIGMVLFPSEVPRGLFAVPAALGAFWGFLWVFAHGSVAGSTGLLARIRDHVLLRTFRRATVAQCLLVLAMKASITVLSLFVHKTALTFFGIDIPLLRLLAFLPIVFMIGALPVTVAHLGTSQAAWIFFFNDHAAEADLLAYSLASHLTFMLANGALGLLFLPKAYADLFVHRRQDDIRSRK